MNPHDFLDLASELVGGSREVDWRSGVSRAYYAAFHTARLLFHECGFAVPQSDRAHAYLWMRLMNCGHPLLESTGDALQQLRRNRNRADYFLDQPYLEADAIREFNLAYDVVRLLEQVAAGSASLAPVVQTIRDYERNALGDVTWQGPSPASSNGGAADET